MRAVLVALVVLVAGCASYAPPPTCDLSANKELCELENRLRRLEYEARQKQFESQARKTCEFAHGSGSILCQ